MKIYQVLHQYEVDGGFGDAIGCKDVVACFESEHDANAFCEKYDRTHIYAEPYDELTCGTLLIKEMELVTHKEFNIKNNPSYYGYKACGWFDIEDWEDTEKYSDTEPLMVPIAPLLELDINML